MRSARSYGGPGDAIYHKPKRCRMEGSRIWRMCFRWLRKDEGQGLTEYALILFAVALAVIATLTLLGGNVTDSLNDAADSFSSRGGGGQGPPAGRGPPPGRGAPAGRGAGR